MLIRNAILLVVLAAFPAAFSRHIDRSTSEETAQNSTTTRGSSSTKRQLRKTHLRIHGKPPKTLRLVEGDSDYLECQAGGTPAPSIHWLKDGNLIPQSEISHEHSPKSTASDGTNSKGRINVSFANARLYLDCLSVQDEGEYTCVAENPYQRISTSTTLTVLSSDEEIECENSQGQAPRITFWTKAMIGTQGQEAKFVCRVDGYPRPNIRWQGPQGEELASEDVEKYQILPEGDLIIKDLSWTDMGNYHCTAENVHGTAKAEVFLYPSVVNK